MGPWVPDMTNRRCDGLLCWVRAPLSPASRARYSPRISKSANLVRDDLHHGNRNHQIFRPSLLSAAFPFQISPENLASSSVSRASLADNNNCWVHMGMHTLSESIGHNGPGDLHRPEKLWLGNAIPSILTGIVIIIIPYL